MPGARVPGCRVLGCRVPGRVIVRLYILGVSIYQHEHEEGCKLIGQILLIETGCFFVDVLDNLPVYRKTLHFDNFLG